MDIEAPVAGAESALSALFAGLDRDVTEENLQARVRGLLLMGLSNKFGDLLVTTGNKSEMSVGYATLCGDMCGGYSVLKDVYKTEVYALSRWRNEHHPDGALGPQGRVIPESSITRHRPPNSAPTRRTRIRCRHATCWMRCSRPGGRRDERARDRVARVPARRGRACSGCCIRLNTSAGRRLPASRSHAGVSDATGAIRSRTRFESRSEASPRYDSQCLLPRFAGRSNLTLSGGSSSQVFSDEGQRAARLEDATGAHTSSVQRPRRTRLAAT